MHPTLALSIWTKYFIRMDELAELVIEASAAVIKAVKQAIEESGLNVHRVSQMALIPPTTLKRRLSGEPFRVDELTRIAAVTGKQLSDFTPARKEGAAA